MMPPHVYVFDSPEETKKTPHAGALAGDSRDTQGGQYDVSRKGHTHNCPHHWPYSERQLTSSKTNDFRRTDMGEKQKRDRHFRKHHQLYAYDCPRDIDNYDDEYTRLLACAFFICLLFIIFVVLLVIYFAANGGTTGRRKNGEADLSQLTGQIDENHRALHAAVSTARIATLIKSVSHDSVGLAQTSPSPAALCPLVPPLFLGASVAGNDTHEGVSLGDVIRDNPDIQLGGKWRPRHCIARHRVAIIIPYRDRLQHLVILLSHLLPILRRQELNFRIFVVEQYGTATFNKGRIMNAAFKEALKMYDFQCVTFHDVDLLPEDDRNMYSCPWQPRHMSVAIDEMDYKLKYDMLVGGVLIFNTEHFLKVNGYSNMYWGWGAEDDDMAYRILHVGLKITRPPSTIARYRMIKHQKRNPTSWHTRSKLLHTAVKRYKVDGLNSVPYKVVFIHEERLFTHIMVDIGRP